MPFFCAIPTNLPHDPNGVLAPPSAGPYYISDRVAEQVDHDQEEPELQGQAPAQRRRRSTTSSATRSTRRTCARSRARPTTPPAASRLRRTPRPLRSTASTRASSGSSRSSASPTWRSTMTARSSRARTGTALAKAVNYAIDRKAMLAQGGYLAGKRTDQILPPGIAGFRDANLYPLKGPDIATAKKWAAKAGVKDGHDRRVLHVEPWLGSARGADRAVQPEADRPEREQRTCSPAPCRSTRKAPVVSRSTSRRKAGSPTTPIRTTSSTCCCPVTACTRRTTTTSRTSTTRRTTRR